jgi:hypothetical protein
MLKRMGRIFFVPFSVAPDELLQLLPAKPLRPIDTYIAAISPLLLHSPGLFQIPRIAAQQ